MVTIANELLEIPSNKEDSRGKMLTGHLWDSFLQFIQLLEDQILAKYPWVLCSNVPENSLNCNF